MSTQAISPKAQRIEDLLDSNANNPINDFLGQESRLKIENSGYSSCDYQVYAVRKNSRAGVEIFGPQQMKIGTYSEEDLYGIAGSPVLRFRRGIQALKRQLDIIHSLKQEDVEYGHQITLFWAEMGQLKEFMGTSPIISELVAEFRTARFQFLGKDTPLAVVCALASAIQLVVEANRFDTQLVDCVVEVLENAGIDSLSPDAMRDACG